MDPFKGIEIQILSGQALKLYDDPDAHEIEDDRTRQLYVEAITGATFSVKVTLTNKFDISALRPTDAIRISLNLDGRCSCGYHFSRADIESNRLRGQVTESTFAGHRQCDAKTGQWTRSDFSFGALELSTLNTSIYRRNDLTLITEEASIPTLSYDKFIELGEIRIKVRRIERKIRDVPKAPSTPTSSMVKEVDEKALKGRGLVNAVR